jgi:hypothetical protein
MRKVRSRIGKCHETSTINYIIDVVMLFSALLCTVTGIIKWPDGPR